MNVLDPLSIILLQVEDLTSSINKKTVKSVSAELQNLARTWGRETELHILRSLLNIIDNSSDNKTSFKESTHFSCLKEFLLTRLCKPGFASGFCSIFDSQIKQTKVTSLSLSQFCKSLHLSRALEVVIGFILLQSSKTDTRNASFDLLRKKLPELLTNYVNPDTSVETGLYDFSVELAHFLLSSILKNPQFGVSNDLIDNFLETLRKSFPRVQIPVILSPFLYNSIKSDGVFDVIADDSEEDISSGDCGDNITNTLIMDSQGTNAPIAKPITGSLALQIQEIGYTFCRDLETCQKHLQALLTNNQSLTASNVAHILAMMVRTHANLKSTAGLPEVMWIDENRDTVDEQTWKAEVFVENVLNTAPNINWREVIDELDHPGFAVKDRNGLILLTKALMMGLKDNPFPVEVLYSAWSNKEGQLSWMQQIIRNADVFCFVDFPHRPVQISDVVRISPEDGKEIHNWRSMDLVDTLLMLGDIPGLSNYVQECLRLPVQCCPELLALGLIQSSMPMTLFRQELLIGLFQLLLGGQTKEARLIVFNCALNSELPIHSNLRQCVLLAMAEWYNRNVDISDRLTRIFHIAIKLKILLDLLSLPQFQFTIDLACLASRCDYVNLNRWLTEKVQAHGEVFVQNCVQFLMRRLPQLMGDTSTPSESGRPDSAAGGSTLAPDRALMILRLLQSVLNHVSQPLGSEIAKMSTQYGASLASMVAGSGASTAPGGPTANPSPTPFGLLNHPVAAAPSPTGNGPSAVVSNSATIRQSFPQTLSQLKQPFAGGFGGLLGSQTDALFQSTNPIGFGKAESVPAQLNSAAAGSLFNNANDFPGHAAAAAFFGHPNFNTTPGAGTSASPATVLQAAFASDPLTTLLKPGAASWGAGFAASASSGAPATSTPLLSSQRTQASQQSLVTSNEPNNPDITQSFTDDIQGEANNYFQQIYAQPPQPSMSIEQFLEVLKRFRDSTEKKQLDVFACMIKNLFEEYNFFEQYPEKELHTTALLFGGVLREGLVSGTPLVVALRIVAEALKKEPGARLFNFGVVALDQFKTRLKEYPRYCQNMLPTVSRNLPPRLLDYVQHGAREEWPPSHQSAATRSITPASQAASVVGQTPTTFVTSTTQPGTAKPAPTLNATNIDTLVHATDKEDSKVAVPPENVVEKVAFLFNNLSQMNMLQKVAEMKGMMVDEHLPWLAQYLVMKRVSAESNFHNLYATFVAAVGNRTLNAIILKETYRNIKILLRSDKAAANFSDRTLLKNLGHWLGMVTLMVNKPILHRDLDVKSLLLEAFWKGQQELLYVVPFLAKILESCQKSKIFKPPNPWTKAILNVMAELHQQPDLKLNLKFEIEVLFRHLSVDISTLKIGNVLKDPVMMERAMKDPQLSNPIRLEKPTMANTLQPSPVPPTTVGAVISSTAVQPIEEQGSSVQTSATPIPVTARFNYHDIYVNNFQGYQGLIPHITVNASLPIFQLNPPLKHLVKPAVEHAVHELMMPVSDRAIKVAMTTTENVIKKDFALDADESRLRIAAQNMARSLAAGMAMITCRDPLAYGIQGYLKQGFYSSIRGATTEQQRMIEEAVQIITDDNVELAQCFIVKFAAERATVEVDKRMVSEFDVRRQARLESRQYYDSSMAKYQSERLPEAIRLKLGSPDQQQLSVYDEFGKNVPGFKSMSADDMFSGSGTTPVAFQSTGIASQAGALSSTGNLQRHFWSGAAAGQQASATSASVTAVGSTAVAHTTEEELLFQQLVRDLDARLQLAQPQAAQTYTACQGVLTLREALAMASQNPRDTVAAQALLQKLVDVTLEAYMPRLIPHHLSTPQEINDFKDWNQLLCDAFLSAVKSFTFIFGGQWIQKQVTKTLIDCRQESRFNVDAIELLIRHQLVNMITYDLQLATTMDNGLNYKAVDFAQHLVRRLFYEDRQMQGCSETDLSNTIDMLNRIANTRMGNAENSAAFGRQSVMDDFGPGFRSSAASSLAAIMNSAAQGQQFVPGSVLSQLGVTPNSSNLAAAAAQAVAVAAAQQHSGMSVRPASSLPLSGSGPGTDPPGLQEKAEYLLREWVGMQHNPATAKDPSKAFSAIVSQSPDRTRLRSSVTCMLAQISKQGSEETKLLFPRYIFTERPTMHQHGILKSDDMIARFFRVCTEMCVDLCYRALNDQVCNQHLVRVRCFHTLDAYVLLIVLLVKHSGDGQPTTKITLLNKIVTILAGVLAQDHKVRREEFHQLPFHRIFITLFIELTANDPLLEPIHMEILTVFCQIFHAIQPRYYPGFTFAWLDIIGHRTFIGRVLVNTANSKAWSMYIQLLTDHLRFLAPFLRNIEFQKSIAMVYAGTLRILLVILHDIPELLCEYHYALCDVIPANCIQLRNLILSAYPRNMRLPDPFMPNLKVDQLPEINQLPRISVNYVQAIQPSSLKNDLDNYLKNRAPVSFLSDLRSKLQISNEPGQKYNLALMNAVILYVGAQAIQAIQAKDQRPSISTIAHTAHMDIFQNFAVDLDTEGRYLFFNAVANQLRYPNSHTHYFSCTLLYLFAESNSEAIQEQITRILFERLVALRPHPWGLLITFIELIKNPYYKFWSHEFVRCAPEIENLFESIARSCMVKHNASESP